MGAIEWVSVGCTDLQPGSRWWTLEYSAVDKAARLPLGHRDLPGGIEEWPARYAAVGPREWVRLGARELLRSGAARRAPGYPEVGHDQRVPVG